MKQTMFNFVLTADVNFRLPILLQLLLCLGISKYMLVLHSVLPMVVSNTILLLE